jgi:hypothetical protein
MTTQITKTWFDGEKMVTQEIPEYEVYKQEPVAWMNNKDFEPIRVRIMQEAYELADRNDSEGYNAIKVMCGDVQRMLPPKRQWVGLTNEEVQYIADSEYEEAFVRLVEDKLKGKNT